MMLSEWRASGRLTLVAAAEMFGIRGKNPARTYQRFETGESAIGADLADDIARLTRGAVTPIDLNATRLAWLKASGRRRAPPRLARLARAVARA